MSKKIVFMGTPDFSVQTLEVLAKSSYDLVCVYTQPPKKSSRGQKINSSSIENISKKLNLKIRSPLNLIDENELNFFKSLNPYLVIVIAYGKIIPKKYLDIPEKGFINIHASLLPKWRGAAPIQRAIMNQDKESGISFMKIEEKLDEGPFFKQIKVKIDQTTTSKNLSEKLSKLGANNILDCIKLIEEDKVSYIKQDGTKATYAKKINKLESKIVWQKKSENILSKINGLNPAPGAWFEYSGSRYKVWKASISNLQGNPGEILDDNITVGCGDKSIQILEIQKEGRRKLTVAEFLRGSILIKGKTIN